jgi:hypothetical protein
LTNGQQTFIVGITKETMMMRSLIFTSLLLAAGSPQMVSAQFVDGALVIYGNDKCPTNKDGQEIVVCSRRSESERYRIPKELRSGGKFAESESWTKRSQSTLSAGRTGIGSCSAVGPGGFLGCAAQDYSVWRQDKKAAKAAEQVVP